MREKRSSCPIACTLDILGDKWTLLIIRDLFCGKSHYRDFLSSPEKISTNILASRLQGLIERGLVKKLPSRIIHGRDGYHLTKKGKSLWPVLEVVADWGIAHIPGTEKRMKPQQEMS